MVCGVLIAATAAEGGLCPGGGCEICERRSQQPTLGGGTACEMCELGSLRTTVSNGQPGSKTGRLAPVDAYYLRHGPFDVVLNMSSLTFLEILALDVEHFFEGGLFKAHGCEHSEGCPIGATLVQLRSVDAGKSVHLVPKGGVCPRDITVCARSDRDATTALRAS